MKKEVTDIVFLLDRSGSMSGLENDTIKSYNNYLERMKSQNVRVTTVLFDDKYEFVTEQTNIKNVKKMDKRTYYTRGSTALLDAVGKTIKYLDHINPKKVLFIITTDGYENSSIEYSKNMIKKLIESHNNWEFIFLGADIDSYTEACSIGIKENRISNYCKSKNGVKKVFDRLKNLSEMYYESNCILEDWNDGLEDD